MVEDKKKVDFTFLHQQLHSLTEKLQELKKEEKTPNRFKVPVYIDQRDLFLFLESLYYEEKSAGSSLSLERKIRILIEEGYPSWTDPSQKKIFEKFTHRLLDKADLGKNEDGFLNQLIAELEIILFLWPTASSFSQEYFFKTVLCASPETILKKLDKLKKDLMFQTQLFYDLYAFRKLICDKTADKIPLGKGQTRDEVRAHLLWLAAKNGFYKPTESALKLSEENPIGEEKVKNPNNMRVLQYGYDQYNDPSIINFLVSTYRARLDKLISPAMIWEIFQDLLLNNIVTLDDILISSETSKSITVKEEFLAKLPQYVAALLKRYQVISIYSDVLEWISDLDDPEAILDSQEEILNLGKLIGAGELISQGIVSSGTAHPKLEKVMDSALNFEQHFRAKIYSELHSLENIEFKCEEKELKNIIKINQLIAKLVTIFNYASHDLLLIKKQFFQEAEQAFNSFSKEPLSERARQVELKVSEYLQRITDVVIRLRDRDPETWFEHFGSEWQVLSCLPASVQRNLVLYAIEKNHFEKLLYFFEYKIGGFDERFLFPYLLQNCAWEAAVVIVGLGIKTGAYSLPHYDSIVPPLTKILFFMCENGLLNCFQRFAKFTFPGYPSIRAVELVAMDSKNEIDFEKSLNSKLKSNSNSLITEGGQINFNYFRQGRLSLLHVAAFRGHLALVEALASPRSIKRDSSWAEIIVSLPPSIDCLTKAKVEDSADTVTPMQYAEGNAQQPNIKACIKFLNSLAQLSGRLPDPQSIPASQLAGPALAIFHLFKKPKFRNPKTFEAKKDESGVFKLMFPKIEKDADALKKICPLLIKFGLKEQDPAVKFLKETCKPYQKAN